MITIIVVQSGHDHLVMTECENSGRPLGDVELCKTRDRFGWKEEEI